MYVKCNYLLKNVFIIKIQKINNLTITMNSMTKYSNKMYLQLGNNKEIKKFSI